MRNAIDSLIKEFGFDCHKSFISSTFGFLLQKKTISISIYLGAISMFIKKWVGLEGVVFATFLALIIFEFITGIRASLKEGNKIESKRFGRVILKMLIYTTMIGMLNVFKNNLSVPSIFGYEFNVFELVYNIVVYGILLQLFISVLENLSRLGYKETSKLFKVVSSIFDRWLKLEGTESENKPKID